MNFEELQTEMNGIIEEVKKSLALPLDAEGKLPSGAHLTLEDLEKLLERTQGVVDKLNKRAVELAAKSGMSREDMGKFVENPANFSPEEWTALQAVKGQVEQFQKMVMKTVASGQEPTAKEAKATHKAPTKRHWIPL